MTRFLGITLLVVAAGPVTACRGAERQVRGASLEERDAAALRLLRAAAARRDRQLSGGWSQRFDPAAVRFESAASPAVSGLTYWWGSYIPPGTADVVLDVVAARGPTESRLLESPTDWFQAAHSAGWHPVTAAAALEGCVDAVETAGPRGWPDRRAWLYRDSSSVTNDEEFGVYPESARAFAVRRGLEEGRLAGDSARGFTGSFWMLEPGQTTRYRCTVLRSSFKLEAIDSLTEMGLMRF